MSGKIVVGDCLEQLRLMPDQSVNCVVTSPPYWGLRSYGVTGQMGLEATVGEYVQGMVDVFREVRRVLRKDGTCWVVMGDTYVSVQGMSRGWRNRFDTDPAARGQHLKRPGSGLKWKDLIGVPWRLALAMQDDGWWLRSEIIWHKRNPYPEAVRDRPTRAHDTIFMFSRSASTRWYRHDETRAWAKEKPPFDYRWVDRASPDKARTAVEPPGWQTETCIVGGRARRRWTRVNLWEGMDYWYDADAIAEPVTGTSNARGKGSSRKADARARQLPIPARDLVREDQGIRPGYRMGHGPGWREKASGSFGAAVTGLVAKRNKRTVWSVPTEPYKGAHFATFPRKLIAPCILAGCPPGGVVLDIFGGSGTTGQVAEDLGRDWILIDINPEYAELQRSRTARRSDLAQAEIPGARR